METIILPGYSLHNKEWAEEVAGQLAASDLTVIVHYWRHWQTGESFSLEYEIEKILAEIGKDKVNIIAKSLGTQVSMHALQKIPKQINKIILCGIPTVSEERLELFQTALKNFPPEKIVVFQNSKDPFASFVEVKEFTAKINPKIKVLEKPRGDHNYPYFEEFNGYLTS